MGTTRVIAYVNPFELSQLSELQPCGPWVHICATPSLKQGLRTHYDYLDGLLFSFAEVMSGLLPEWTGSAVRLGQFAKLTELIDRMRQAAAGDPARLQRLTAFRRNQKEALLAIRLLVECGLRPSDLLPDRSRPDEAIFQELWRLFEADDDGVITRFRSSLERLTAQPEELDGALLNALNLAIEQRNQDDETRHKPLQTHGHRLVMHGFYFITPIQQRIAALLEKAGFDLLYLNCYDPHYPTVFQSWTAFFTRQTGLPEPDAWQYLPSQTPPPGTGPVLGDLIEGRQPDPAAMAGQVSILRYPDFGSFLDRFRRDVPLPGKGPKTAVYYSPEARSVTRFLREYYAPVRDRHFLSYPSGQLLFHLHQMWDETSDGGRGGLVLSERPLYECFASGWLQVDGLNGRDYLQALEAILPFFQGVESLGDWLERAELLRAARAEVADRFDAPVPWTHPNARFHQLQSNPFERISYLAVDSETIGAIVQLMRHLARIAEDLFGHDRIGISRHFDRIEAMLTSGLDKEDLLSEEYQLLRNLRRRMAQVQTGQAFLPKDLAQAVLYYLGGNLLAEEEDEPESDHLVSRFDRLDGAPLSHSSRDMHICLLGDKSLPKHKPAFPWPLSAESFRHLPGNVAIELLRLREAHSKSADRYLLYNALAWSPRATLSWISDWQEELLGPSPLLALLSVCYPIREVSVEGWNPARQTPEHPGPAAAAPARPDQYELLPVEAVADFALCPRRFYYSYLTRQLPSFTSDFHHQFLYGSLVKALAVASGRNPADVAPHVSALFPQWHDLMRKDLLERTPNPKSEGDAYDGAEYPEARYPLHFLTLSDKEEMEPAARVLEDPGAFRDALAGLTAALADLRARPEPRPGHICRYCPHSHACDAAHFPVDDEE